jgi:flagella basal body P-ring formation protein FlgA
LKEFSMRVLFVVLLAAPLATLPATAVGNALLRPHAVVQGADVMLSEIFVGASDIVAFRSPAPGRRLVLEAPQVAQLARAHGIAWRPSPGAERVVVERPGRMLARELAEDALRLALAPLGGGEHDGFDLATPLPLVASNITPFVNAEDAAFDISTGRFSATLVIDGGDGSEQRSRVSGRAWPGVLAVVAAHRLATNETLRPGSLRLARVRADRAGQALADITEAMDKVPRRPITAGQPVLAADLVRPAVVLKNSAVMMSIDLPGMSITAQARALEDGAPGAMIRVQNVASRAVVEAQVIGAGRVRVGAGSLPVTPPARQPANR